MPAFQNQNINDVGSALAVKQMTVGYVSSAVTRRNLEDQTGSGNVVSRKDALSPRIVQQKSTLLLVYTCLVLIMMFMLS